MKKGPFYAADIKTIDRTFYEGLDSSFIFNRAMTLYAAATQEDAFLTFSNNVLIVLPEERQRFFDSLRADILFAQYQQTEALFALVAAAFQHSPHWLYLSRYRYEELREKIKQYVAGDYSAFSGIATATMEKVVNWAIYANCSPASEKEQAEWPNNLSKIDRILRKAGNRYLEGNEYNAYKHGVRILTGKHGRSFSKKGEALPFLTVESKDSVSYLDVRQDDAGNQHLCITTKHFNSEESITYLQTMAELVRSIKNTRLARIRNDERTEWADFTDFDMKAFDSLMVYAKFSDDV